MVLVSTQASRLHTFLHLGSRWCRLIRYLFFLPRPARSVEPGGTWLRIVLPSCYRVSMDARGDGNMCSAHGRQSTRNELASMKATRSTLRDGGRVRQNDATNPVHNTHPNVDNRQSTNEKSFSFAVQHCVLFLTLSLSHSLSLVGCRRFRQWIHNHHVYSQWGVG